jgi:hypothetical protein
LLNDALFVRLKVSEVPKVYVIKRFGDENMKRFYVISICFVISCALFLQIGCEKQTASPKEPKEKVAAVPESTVVPAETETSPESDELMPEITFESLVYDFGEIEPSKKIVGEFKFKNTGNGPLKITKIDKCCGAVLSLDKASKEYAPGENGLLTVEYHSSSRSGTMTRQLHIHSNDKKNPNVTLTIKAKVVAIVEYEPKHIGLTLNSENAKCPEITITCLDNKPFSIKDFKSPGDCITADVNTAVQATKFVLSPKVDTEKLQQHLNGNIEISLTRPGFSSITIPYSTLPRFKVNPPVFIVFDAEPQKAVKRDAWVLNNYDEDFKIVSTSSKNGIIKILNQEEISKGYHLEAEITPPANDRKQKIFTDVLTIDIEGNEPLEISCRGFYHNPEKSSPDS